MGRRGLIFVAGIAALVAAGCSTTPCVDLCDGLCPGRMYPDKVPQRYGGTCIPQGCDFRATAPSAPLGAGIPPPVPVGPSAPSGPITIPTLPGPPPGGVAPGAIVPVPAAPPPAFPKV